MINGVAYDWQSITVSLLGRPVVGITSIEYDDALAKANNYGAGAYPVSRGRGKYEAKCKLTLQMEEVAAIQKALPAGQRLQDIASFPITVSYLPSDATRRTTDRINFCEFTSNSRKVKQGDMEIAIEFDLIVSHIEWNV